MTRKDYILIAQALKESMALPGIAATPDAIRVAAETFAFHLRRDNPAFVSEHFVAVVLGQKDLNSRPTRRAS